MDTGVHTHWDGVRKKSRSVTSVGEDSGKLEPNAVPVGTECCGRWATELPEPRRSHADPAVPGAQEKPAHRH